MRLEGDQYEFIFMYKYGNLDLQNRLQSTIIYRCIIKRSHLLSLKGLLMSRQGEVTPSATPSLRP